MANLLLNSRLSAKRILLLIGIIAGLQLAAHRLKFGEGYAYSSVHKEARDCGIPAEPMSSVPSLEEMATTVSPAVENDYDMKICDRFGESYNASQLPNAMKGMGHLFVVDKLQLLFCYVPKVACTNWKRILMILQGSLDIKRRVTHMEVHQRADRSLRTVAHLKPAELRKVMNYTKILFVRDPFTRLLSAYRDKLEKAGRVDSDRFRSRWSAKMASRTSADRARRQKNDVTFEEFADYLANPSNTLDIGEEEHWRPINRLCKPCAIKYDFVGRFEQLERDSRYALNDLLHSNFTGGLINSTNLTNSSDNALLDKYFSGLKLETLKGLYKRYQLDFELFGYQSLQQLVAELVKPSGNDKRTQGKESKPGIRS